MFSAPSFPMFLSHPFNIIIITVNEASLALRVKKFPRFSYLFVSFLCDSFFLCFDKTTPMSFDRYCHRLWWMVTLSWQFNFSSVIYTIKFELILSRKLLKIHTIKLFLLSRTNADQTLFLFNHFSLRSMRRLSLFDETAISWDSLTYTAVDWCIRYMKNISSFSARLCKIEQSKSTYSHSFQSHFHLSIFCSSVAFLKFSAFKFIAFQSDQTALLYIRIFR